MYRNASKKQTSKLHDRSLDDFMKNLKKYNLRSQRNQRYHSPDPYAPYRRLPTQTLDRSRTISAKQSRHTNKTTRKKVQKLLAGSLTAFQPRQKTQEMKGRYGHINGKVSKSADLVAASWDPADLIAEFCRRIHQAELYLQGRSKMGLMLCRKFVDMLNELVENMVNSMQKNIVQLQAKVAQRIQKQMEQRGDRRVAKLQKKIKKLESKTIMLVEKENYNSNLIYHLRLQNIDVDRYFGRCIFGSDGFGGAGYHPSNSESESKSAVLMRRNDELPSEELQAEVFEWSSPKEPDKSQRQREAKQQEFYRRRQKQ